MKNIGINSPCSENWNEMSKNDKGAFCQKCASQVFDFTKKSSLEIKQTLLSFVGKPVCGRITQTQEEVLNLEFETWMNQKSSSPLGWKQSFQSLLIFSLIVVFGMTLFSCENEQDSKKIRTIQTEIARIIEQNNDSLKIIPQEQSIEIPKIETATENRFETMGKMVMPNEYLEEIQAIEVIQEVIDLDQSYAGGMSWSRNYETFLIEQVNQSPDVYDENGNLIPKIFDALAFPNPAKEKTTFELSLPTKSIFEINLYDMNGKMLKSIYSGEIEKGKFRQEIDLIDLNTGIYLIVINSKDYQNTVRLSKI